MAIDWVADLAEAAPPFDSEEAGSLVVRRSWLVAPEKLPLGEIRPILTGLYGYPWRTGSLDARCTASSRLDRDFTLPPRVEPHHPTVPEPSCSCGVYANRDEAAGSPGLRTARGVPVATGFVALSGRIITEPAGHRAQAATIIGPLILHPGRPPLGAVLLRRPVKPQRVVSLGAEFLVRWAGGATGPDWIEWVTMTARSLAERYAVEVFPSFA